MPQPSKPAFSESPLSRSLLPSSYIAEPQFLRPGPRLGHEIRLILSKLLAPRLDVQRHSWIMESRRSGVKKPIIQASHPSNAMNVWFGRESYELIKFSFLWGEFVLQCIVPIISKSSCCACFWMIISLKSFKKWSLIIQLIFNTVPMSNTVFPCSFMYHLWNVNCKFSLEPQLINIKEMRGKLF